MKKKAFAIMTAMGMICLSLVMSCFRRTAVGAEPKTLGDLNGRMLGMLVSPALVKPADVKETINILPSEVRSFPTSNELVMALKTRRVDAILSTGDTAKFLISADNRLNIISAGTPQESGLRMMLRKSDDTLLQELNGAIAALQADGTLDRLYDQYIRDSTVENLVSAPAQLPVIEGAPTILAGINGDLPPYDYMTAEGKPAGYNVALMSEISRVLGKNVRFVTVPSEARFSTLLSDNSRRMDLFFWFYGSMKIDNLVLTDPYGRVEECILVRK